MPDAMTGPKYYTIRERAEHRVESMKRIRAPYEDDYREIARLALPSRSEYMMPTHQTMKRRANTSKQDTAGLLAGRTLVNGMSTGLSSNARPWFKIESPDPELMEYQPAKEWYWAVQQEIYSLFASTNYYDANKVAYAQLGYMGTAVNVMLEHDQYMMVSHPLEVMEYWIAQDDGLRVIALARMLAMTVAQMVEAFPWRKLTQPVRNAYNNGNVHQLVKVWNLIEYNKDHDGEYWDYGNKPWRSIWWEEANSSKKDEDLLRLSGFDSKPFTAPRWSTTGAQVYSDQAPSWDALPDLRELEMLGRRKGRALDNLVKPALAVPAGLQQTPLSLDPGSINFVNELQNKVEPIIRPDGNVMVAVRGEVDAVTRRVNQIFYADLWMAITDMEGIQPRNEQEIFYRNEEKLTQLGPVVDRVNIEKLEGDVDRAYRILRSLGRIPPAPPEVARTGMKIEFISILAQAQKAVANTQIERIARFVGFLSATFPDAAMKFDAQQAVDEYAQNTGVTPNIIRSDEIVAQLIEEAKAQQQAQAAMAAAPAARDGAQAAELLSRTQVGSQDRSMLDQLMNQ